MSAVPAFLRKRAPLLVAGLYVWLVGVLPAHLGGTGARLLLGLALLFLLSGTLLPRAWALRWFALYGFLGASLGALVVSETNRSADGSPFFVGLGWLAYTFAWGMVGHESASSEEAPVAAVRLDKLLPRQATSRALFLLPLVGAGAGLYLFRAPLGIERLEARILAVVLLLGAGLLLIRLSGELGAYLHRSEPHGRPRASAWALWVLFIGFAVLGLFLRSRAG